MMTKGVFKSRYSLKKEQSQNFSNLRPIRLFVHEICCCDQDEIEEAILYIKTIEKDLIDNHIIKFEIKDYWDIDKINVNTDIGFIQWCIWNLISRIKKVG